MLPGAAATHSGQHHADNDGPVDLSQVSRSVKAGSSSALSTTSRVAVRPSTTTNQKISQPPSPRTKLCSTASATKCDNAGCRRYSLSGELVLPAAKSMTKGKPLRKGEGARRPKAAGKRRPRRSTQEVIDCLIEAAGEEFERNGFGGTTTAAIAQRAGVAEFLIFKHFGSKARLFEDSIFKPLNQHLQDFCATHLVDAADTEGLKKETQRYILELLRFMEHHSRALMSVLMTQIYEHEGIDGSSDLSGLQEYFSRTQAMGMSRRPGKTQVNHKLMSRASFATVAACVIFKNVFFPKGLGSEKEVHAAICDYVMYGIHTAGDPKPGG